MAKYTGLIDLTGKRFGKFTVIARDSRKGATYWLCRCDCGNEKVVDGSMIRSGEAAKSCGDCTIYPYYATKPIMQITADSMFGTIQQTDSGEYKAYFLNEYIGTFKTYQSAYAARRLCEFALFATDEDSYYEMIHKSKE